MDKKYVITSTTLIAAESEAEAVIKFWQNQKATEPVNLVQVEPSESIFEELSEEETKRYG